MAALLHARSFAPFTSARPQRMAISRSPLLQAPARLQAPRLQRGALQVVAADEDGKVVVKKAISSPVKRAMLAEERRLVNRSRKSACATRIKKVIKLAIVMWTTAPIKTEDEIKPLEKLVAEAYQEIDKAVVKGILHKNNGARKKARVARYKRQVLMSAGFFKPSESHPDYNKFLRMQPAAKLAVKEAKVVAAKAPAAKAAVSNKGGKAPATKGKTGGKK